MSGMITDIADIFYRKTTFGDSLRRLRRARGLSLLEMMEKTGIYYNSLSEYESGLSVPDATRIYKICEALGGDHTMHIHMLELARSVYMPPAAPVATQSHARRKQHA